MEILEITKVTKIAFKIIILPFEHNLMTQIKKIFDFSSKKSVFNEEKMAESINTAKKCKKSAIFLCILQTIV